MRLCNKCKIIINDYQGGKYNPNGHYIGIRNEDTNWKWKIKCPHCGNIQDEQKAL